MREDAVHEGRVWVEEVKTFDVGVEIEGGGVG